jgi:chromosome segregation ATPase
MALFTRAGFDQKTAAEALQVSINLAALKNISLSDSAQMVDLALMGNGRSIRELGIDMKSLTAEQDTSETAAKNLDTAQKNVDTSSQHLAVSQQSLRDLEDSLHAKRTLSQVDLDHLAEKQAAVTKASNDLKEAQGKLTTAQDTAGVSTDKQQKILAELAQKTDAGTDSVTRMEQAQNRLNRTAQDASVGVGKVLVPAISNLLDITDLASRSAGLAWEHPSRAVALFQQQLPGVATATNDVTTSTTKLAAAQASTADGTESVVSRMSRLQNTTVTLSSTSHNAAEHLDQQAAAATEAGGAHKFLQESIETATTAETQHNKEVDRYLRQEPAVTAGLGATAHLADTNADSLRLAAEGMDSFNNATRAAEFQTGIAATNMVQGINDIKEAIDHTKQDRLEISVDASAVNAALQNLLALQQAAARGVNVSISTAGDLGPGNGLLSGLFG